jgi:hypothetical protein
MSSKVAVVKLRLEALNYAGRLSTEMTLFMTLNSDFARLNAVITQIFPHSGHLTLLLTKTTSFNR